jgi:hypothetical protein
MDSALCYLSQVSQEPNLVSPGFPSSPLATASMDYKLISWTLHKMQGIAIEKRNPEYWLFFRASLFEESNIRQLFRPRQCFRRRYFPNLRKGGRRLLRFFSFELCHPGLERGVFCTKSLVVSHAGYAWEIMADRTGDKTRSTNRYCEDNRIASGWHRPGAAPRESPDGLSKS